MDRTDDTLIPENTGWIDAARPVCAMLSDKGFQVYFVGGCVRDALLGRKAGDVDLTTDAHPQQVLKLAKHAGFKAIPTGIDHGTITVISGEIPYEVTTFRKDVETDGRRAVVAFSDNVEDDAQRRDFTMNALYATAEGRVLDPVQGLPDLRAGRVRFIGNAEHRIREDYLRTLRFFRFQAWYGDADAGFDPLALNAIASNLDGLEKLSPERIGSEMRKLLRATDPAPALASMRRTGVLARILPGADDRMLVFVVHGESVLGLDACMMTRLVALGGNDVPDRLRLSRAEARSYALLREVGFAGPGMAELAYRHGHDTATAAVLLRAAMAETEPNYADLETISKASRAVFPVRAADLMPALSGPALGAALKRMESAWIASDFTADRDTLLNTDKT